MAKNKTRYGLWENGNKLIWFSPEQKEKICKSSYFYAQHFKDSSSVNNVWPNAQFGKPEGFE